MLHEPALQQHRYRPRILFAWEPDLDALTPYRGEGAGTFARNSIATYVDSDGVIQQVSANAARYQDSGILLEPQRTNLFLNSDPSANEGAALAVSYAPKTWDVGVLAQSTVFGDNSTVRYRYGPTLSATTQYSMSFYVEMDDASEPSIGVTTSTGDFRVLCGNVDLGSVTKENVKGNVWRVSGVATTGTTNLNITGIIKYTGQSAKSFVVSGFQVEAGSYPTSYIPTAGTSVTRERDTLNLGVNGAITADGETLHVAFTGVIAGSGQFLRAGTSTPGAGDFLALFTGEQINLGGQSDYPVAFTGVPAVAAGTADDWTIAIDVPSAQAYEYDGNDAAGTPTAVAVSAGLVYDGAATFHSTNLSMPIILRAILRVRGLLTPSQMRSLLRA